MNWFKKLFTSNSQSEKSESIIENDLSQSLKNQSGSNSKPADLQETTSKTSKLDKFDDSELKNIIKEIEKKIKDKNDSVYPLISLLVERQSLGTSPVTICLPGDRSKVDPTDDLCILWLYPNNKGLANQEAEELLMTYLKPLGYKLFQPLNSYRKDGDPSHQHWIIRKSEIELDPVVIESNQILNGHESYINSLSFSPDGTILASCSGAYGDTDNTVRLWDPKLHKQIKIIYKSGERISGVAFSFDNKIVASVGTSINIFDVIKGKPEWEAELYYSKGIRANNACISPNGLNLVCGCSDANIRIWELKNGYFKRTFSGHSKGVTCVTFSPDGKQIASGSFDGTVRTWDISTGECLKVLRNHRSDIKSISYSSDGKLFASGSEDKTIRIWNTGTWNEEKLLTGHTSNVNCVSFSPDSKVLASGSDDTKIILWDANSGKQLYLLIGHTSMVNCLSFSPNNKTLASGACDKTIRMWDVSVVSKTEEEYRMDIKPDIKPEELIKELHGKITEESASISVFSISEEANAHIQSQIDYSYSRQPSNGVCTYLLKSKKPETKENILLINTGLKVSLTKMYESYNRKGLYDKILKVIPTEQASAIKPVPAYHNYSLPGMDLLPGDHLKPFRDAIINGDYEFLGLIAPENIVKAIRDWEKEQEKQISNVIEAETIFSVALKNAVDEAKREGKVPIKEIYIRDLMGDLVIAWSSPDTGANFNSDRAKEILAKFISPLGYKVKRPFVGGDMKDKSCICHFYGFVKIE